MIARRHLLAGIAAAPVAVRATAAAPPGAAIIAYRPAMHAIVAPDAKIEVLGEGYSWAEGPLWVAHGGFLLFSDVPGNIVHRWTPGKGVAPFLDPSGHPRPVPEAIREGGANGLALDARGRLLLADSGNRAIVRRDFGTGERTVLADRYAGRRFNSPNDLVAAPDGSIWFTDPPYGLKDGDQSPLKEQAVNGVYRLRPDGTVQLLTGELSRPNGIALSDNGRRLLVAQSDEAHPQILEWQLGTDGGPVGGPRLFHDFSAGLKAKLPGLPDGLKIDGKGRVFATGPGGVTVFAPDGEPLGRIATGGPIANCAFGEDGRSLFLAAWKQVARVRLLPD